jgi:hypothetical protein
VRKTLDATRLTLARELATAIAGRAGLLKGILRATVVSLFVLEAFRSETEHPRLPRTVEGHGEGEATMKARRLIHGASFDPEVVHAMGLAFDQAWMQIAGNFCSDASRIEEARMRLAEAMISIASEHSTNVEALRKGALQAMARDYRVVVVRPPTNT